MSDEAIKDYLYGCAIIGGAFVLISVGVVILFPDDRTPEQQKADSETMEWARQREDQDIALKNAGRRRLKEELRDPGSLAIIEESIIRPGRYGSDAGYYAKYRAKNGFGGLTVEEYYTE